jgi:SAM-dependent methyltransferase
MTSTNADKVFDGSIPEFYDTYLTPLIFEPYANDLAQRVLREPVDAVLEVAAGTGVVTRALVDALGPDVPIMATDLNESMLSHGATVRADASVSRQVADAQSLPFDDGSFDAVVCQFAVMFFPDRAQAYAEARRVLRPGGRFLFNVWDSLKDNDLPRILSETLAEVFPDDPPDFLARTPYGYSNLDTITDDLRRAGFTAESQCETLAARSKAADPSVAAMAFCHGTPLRNEILARDASLLTHVTQRVAAEISTQCGPGPIDAKIQAKIISARA